MHPIELWTDSPNRTKPAAGRKRQQVEPKYLWNVSPRPAVGLAAAASLPSRSQHPRRDRRPPVAHLWLAQIPPGSQDQMHAAEGLGWADVCLQGSHLALPQPGRQQRRLNDLLEMFVSYPGRWQTWTIGDFSVQTTIRRAWRFIEWKTKQRDWWIWLWWSNLVYHRKRNLRVSALCGQLDI